MLAVLSIILVVLLIAIGEERGVASVFTLIGNVIVLIAGIYLIANGMNIFLAVFLCSIIFSGITLCAQNGINEKTISAVISVVIVTVLLMIVCAFVLYRAHLGGYSEMDMYGDEAPFLNNKIHINSFEIMTAVVLLSLLGAIMDTALSIATAVYEVFVNNPSLSRSELIKSGGNIGRDILGTTVNTLFFACIGESLLLMMMFARYHYGLSALLNSKAFVQELFIIVSSNVGCMIIIPLASVVTAGIVKKYGTFP
jgi:uncharacterized membrane protein